MVVRDALGQPYQVIGKEEDTNGIVPVEVAEEAKPPEADIGGKRVRSPEDSEAPTAKRLRVSAEPSASTPCLAPSENPVAQKVLSSMPDQTPNGETGENATASVPCQSGGDVFLTDGWRARWCRCQSVRRRTRDLLEKH